MTMRKLHPHQEIVGLHGLCAEDFWIWAYSDMLDNTVRNAFAEFIVGFILGRLSNPRPGQESFGFVYREKLVTIKAASYTQNKEQKKKSKINFDIAVRKNHKHLLDDFNREEAVRPSHCYVFCLFTYDNFHDKDAARNALLDIDWWRFYVIPTQLLDKLLPDNKTVGVTWLENHCEGGPVTYKQLKQRIDYALGFSDEM